MEFLKGNIPFYRISEVVGETVEDLAVAKNAHSLDAIIGYDREARVIARKKLNVPS